MIELVFLLVGEENINTVGNIARAYALTIEYTNKSKFSIKSFIRNNINFNIKREKQKNQCDNYKVIPDPDMKQYVSTRRKIYAHEGVLFICESKLNTWVNQSLSVLDRWFSYMLPKYISAINNIQKEILITKGIEPGDYSTYASVIEFGNKIETKVLLEEMGLPFTAVDRIYKSNHHLYEKPLDEVIEYIVKNKFEGLSNFEKNMLNLFISKF